MKALLAMWMLDGGFAAGFMLFLIGLHTLGWLIGVGSSLIFSQLMPFAHPHRLREVLIHFGVLLVGALASIVFIFTIGGQTDPVREAAGRIYVILTFFIGFFAAYLSSGLARRVQSHPEQKMTPNVAST